jgi:hypothetical protein
MKHFSAKIMAMKRNKKTVVCIALSSFFLALAITLLWTANTNLWSPFERVEAYSGETNQFIKVKVETKKPAKTVLAYGTSDLYMIEKEITTNYQKEHEIVVSGILPKKHFVKVIAITQSGKQHTSKVYEVE